MTFVWEKDEIFSGGAFEGDSGDMTRIEGIVLKLDKDKSLESCKKPSFLLGLDLEFSSSTLFSKSIFCFFSFPSSLLLCLISDTINLLASDFSLANLISFSVSSLARSFTLLCRFKFSSSMSRILSIVVSDLCSLISLLVLSLS